MNKTKPIIDEYNNNIYPITLVVCNQFVKLKDILKKYMLTNNKEITQDMFDSKACTIQCVNKDTDHLCELVKVNYTEGNNAKEKELCLINSVVHETMHVVLDTFDYLGDPISYSVQEPLAYYAGWISLCIFKTYKKK